MQKTEYLTLDDVINERLRGVLTLPDQLDSFEGAVATFNGNNNDFTPERDELAEIQLDYDETNNELGVMVIRTKGMTNFEDGDTIDIFVKVYGFWK